MAEITENLAELEADVDGKITKLALNDKRMCRPKNIGKLCKALAVNATLTELDLSGCNIEDGGAREVADALEANVVLRSLNLARNRITDRGAAELSDALLCFNTTLEYLDMCGNPIGGNSPSPRCQAWNVSTAPSRLAACPNLTYLDMSSSGIGDGDTLCIAEVLSCSSRLTALNLGHNEIGQSSTASHKLAEALAGNTHLRELSVSDNGIDLEFVRLLLQSTSLVSLDISMNWLGERAGEMLREALETRMASSLRVLNCSNMSMGCDGARELVKCLGVLEELNLSANDLGSLHRIARPLVLCSTLKRLNLCYSGLGLCGPESAWELAREMKDSNACLEELDLSGNDIGGLGAFSLAEALEAHTVLKKLNLRNNGIDDSGASRLAQALLINTCLRELNLRKNELTTSGIAHILNAAVDGGRLTILNIAENMLTRQDYENISDALDSRRSDMCALKELYASSYENAWESTSLLFEGLKFNKRLELLDIRSVPPPDSLQPVTQQYHGDLGGERGASSQTLHGHGLGDVNPSHYTLADSLRANCSLSHLSLRNCVLSREELIAVGAAIRDMPRRHGFVLEHADLRGVALELGLPSEAKDWSNKRIIREWETAWEDALMSFAMGTHDRLGGARSKEGQDDGDSTGAPSLVYSLHQHVLELVGQAYWGSIGIEEEEEEEVVEDGNVPEWAWGRMRFLSILPTPL